MSTKGEGAISRILARIKPIDRAKMTAKMGIAAKIDEAMKAKGWKKKDLLDAMGRKTPSIITKWLSGTHNFTIDTLVEFQVALEINLLNTELEQVDSISESNQTFEIHISISGKRVNTDKIAEYRFNNALLCRRAA